MDTPLTLREAKPLTQEEQAEKELAEFEAELDQLLKKATSPIIYFPPREE